MVRVRSEWRDGAGDVFGEGKAFGKRVAYATILRIFFGGLINLRFRSCFRTCDVRGTTDVLLMTNCGKYKDN